MVFKNLNLSVLVLWMKVTLVLKRVNWQVRIDKTMIMMDSRFPYNGVQDWLIERIFVIVNPLKMSVAIHTIIFNNNHMANQVNLQFEIFL